jgi:hypothetical protein
VGHEKTRVIWCQIDTLLKGTVRFSMRTWQK